MGHGDEILLADAHFPGDTFGKRVIRADGHSIPALLKAILPLLPLDAYLKVLLAMMSAVPGDSLGPGVEATYRSAIASSGIDKDIQIERVERFNFYERVKTNYAVVMTGEMSKYGKLILKKGLANI
jgi:L-fucose mutarotase